LSAWRGRGIGAFSCLTAPLIRRCSASLHQKS
jgi:hypothetical protein